MLDLNNVTSGYSTNVINNNFSEIERYINENLLNRDGVNPGEPNQMEVDLDMNSRDILNVGELGAKKIVLDGVSIKDLLDNAVEEAAQEADRAEQEADRSGQEADRSEREADRAERAVGDLNGPYEFVGDYVPDTTLTKYNQLVRDENGEFWRVSGQVDLPYTTTGDGLPENGAFVPVGDAVLRQDLANPDQGAAMVAYGGGTVADKLDETVSGAETAESLHAIGMGSPIDGQTVFVSKFHPEAPYGGYSYKWSSQEPKANHDGSRVIAPEVPWVDLQDEGALWRVEDSALAKRLFLYRNGAGAELSGNGCWVATGAFPPVVGATASVDIGSASNTTTYIRAIQPFRDYIIVLSMGAYGDGSGVSVIDVCRLVDNTTIEKIYSHELDVEGVYDWRELWMYDDRYLYCTSFGSGESRKIAIFDLSDLPRLSLLKYEDRQGLLVTTVGSPRVVGTSVYFSAWSPGASVGRMDLSDPLNPTVVQRLNPFGEGTYPEGIRSAETVVYGGRLYVALYNDNRLESEPNYFVAVYKILDDGNLALENMFTDPDQNPTRSIEISDGFLFVGDFNNGKGATVYDISGDLPQKVSYYPQVSASRVGMYDKEVIIGSPNVSSGGFKYSIWNPLSSDYWTEIVQEGVGYYPVPYRGGTLYGELGVGAPAKIKFFNDRALLSANGVDYLEKEERWTLSSPIKQSSKISSMGDTLSLAKGGTKLSIGDQKGWMGSRVSVFAELDARVSTGSCISYTGAVGDTGSNPSQNYSILGFKTPPRALSPSYTPILSFDRDSSLNWVVISLDIVASRSYGSRTAGMFKVHVSSYDSDTPIVTQEGVSYVRGKAASESIMGVLEFSAVESAGKITILAKSSLTYGGVVFSGVIQGVGVFLGLEAGGNIVTDV